MKSRLATKPALLLKLAALLSLSAAQNYTDNQYCYNIGSSSPNAPVNTTLTRSFQWDGKGEKWLFTVNFNDTRFFDGTRSQLNETVDQELQGWISAPNNANEKVCAYVLGEINKTSGSGEDGCSGVLSTGCAEWLAKDMRGRIPLFFDLNGECLDLPDSEGWKEHCGAGRGTGNILSTGTPINFTENNMCAVSDPPMVLNPSNYFSMPAMGFGYVSDQVDTDVGNFTWYDRHVRNARPWILTKVDGESLQTQVLCMSPIQLLRNSRQPAGEWLPERESAVGRKKLSISMVFAAVAAVALLS